MAVLALLAGLLLAACGADARKHTWPVPGETDASGPARATATVVQVGARPITGATYEHWLAVGAATVDMPKLGKPLPTPITYEPPRFTACIARLHASAPKPATVSQLRAKCQKSYRAVQNRILNFLITGYWLRGEAAERHASVTQAEVRKRFEEEKRAGYPTAASFRSLKEASRQTVADLMFAVETQMLSQKLLEKFTKTHSHETPEQAVIAAFNQSIREKWTARTSCEPGYVVQDCRQYKSQQASTSGD